MYKAIIIMGLMAMSTNAAANGVVGKCTAGNCYNGTGTYFSEDGDIFKGKFVNGSFNGNKNSVVLSSGHTLTGQFKNWLISEGTLNYPTGELYVGRFKDLLPDGTGQMVHTDNSVYIGEWKTGEKSGNGRLDYADGTWYSGGWKHDQWEGDGLFFDGQSISKTKSKGGKVSY